MSFKPVDLRFGQNIIQNYLATIESQQNQQKLEQNKEQLKLQKEQLDQAQRLEEAKLEQQQLAEQHTFELGQGHLDLIHQAQQHELAQKYLGLAAQGITPPGGSIEQPQLSTPEPGSGMQPISQTLGLGVDQQRVSFDPSLGIPPTTTLNPIAAAKLRGAAGLEEIRPKEDLAVKTAEAKGTFDLNKEFLILQQKTLQDQLDRQSRERIAQAENARALGVAKLTQIGELQRQFLNRTSTSFDSHPIVRDYNTLKLANDTAQGNPSDLELLAAYAKALNPAQAAAPEWAITLPQELPSIAQRLGLKLDSITNAKKFIPTKLGDQLKTEIKNRFALQESAYKNFRGSEASKLSQVGIENPEQWLTDYSKANLSGPKVGDTVDVGGGKKVKISKIYPDGSIDGDEVK